MKEFLAIAHRGASGSVFENSPSAFKKAIALGADMIETDVRRTLDGELVIMHDYSIKGSTGHVGRVAKLTLRELQKIRLRNDEEIWTVERLLGETRGKIQVNLEIKAKRVVESLVKLVKRMDLTEEILYSNFRMNTLKKIKALDPTARVGFLTIFPISFLRVANFLKKLVKIGGEALCPEHLLLSRSTMRISHGLNLKVFPWTVNDPRKIKKCLEFGADGVMTDYPEMVIGLRNRIGKVI